MYPSAPPGPPRPPRPPGTVVVLRILAWIQVGGLGLLVLAALLLAGFSSAGLQDEDELTQGFATLGVFAGILSAGFGVLLIAALLVPTVLLRTGRRARKTGALVSLTVVEGVFTAVGLLWIVAALTGRSPADAVTPVLLTTVPVVVMVLALQPASRSWAATHPDGVPPWGAAPAPPAWSGPPPSVGWNGPTPTPPPSDGWTTEPTTPPPPSPWARPD